MEKSNILDALEFVNKSMIEAQKRYKVIYDLIGEKDLETIDYLHQLELKNMNDKEKRKWQRNFKKCRKDRREYKNEIEELEVLKNLYESSMVQSSIQNAIYNLKKIEKNRENLRYNPRILKDLDFK